MKTILVSGASGVVGYGTLKSLRASGKELKLIGTSIYDNSIAPKFCDTFELAPKTTDGAYLDWLLTTIRRHQVDLIIPGIEIDMYTWVEHIPAIRENGAIPLLNNTDLIHLCKDKWVFYENLREAGIACAIESSLSNDFDELQNKFQLPFLLKPRRGFASRGIVKVHSAENFMRYKMDIGSILMAQPIVGSDDEEYTISAFCDGDGGLYACMALRRTLAFDGSTDKAEVVDTKEFMPTILTLCERFRPMGPTNFQFRKGKATGEIKLLEINPRVSSATSIRTAFGYNESAMAVSHYLEQQLPVQPEIKRGRAVRYVEEHIFYDDSIHL